MSGQIRVLIATLPRRKLVAVSSDPPIVAARVGKQVVAFEDRCPHLGMPLSQAGRVCWRRIECGVHGASFSVVTGARRSGPTMQPLRRYEVEQDGDMVIIYTGTPAASALR